MFFPNPNGVESIESRAAIQPLQGCFRFLLFTQGSLADSATLG